MLQHDVASELKVAAEFWVNSEHVKHNSCMGTSLLQPSSFEIWLMYDGKAANLRWDFTTRVLAILSPSFCQAEGAFDTGTAGE